MTSPKNLNFWTRCPPPSPAVTFRPTSLPLKVTSLLSLRIWKFFQGSDHTNDWLKSRLETVQNSDLNRCTLGVKLAILQFTITKKSCLVFPAQSRVPNAILCSQWIAVFPVQYCVVQHWSCVFLGLWTLRSLRPLVKNFAEQRKRSANTAIWCTQRICIGNTRFALGTQLCAGNTEHDFLVRVNCRIAVKSNFLKMFELFEKFRIFCKFSSKSARIHLKIFRKFSPYTVIKVTSLFRSPPPPLRHLPSPFLKNFLTPCPPSAGDVIYGWALCGRGSNPRPIRQRCSRIR